VAVFKNELQLDTASFQASLKKVAAEGKATAAQLNDSFDNLTINPKVEIDPKAIAGQVQSSFKDAFAGGVIGGIVAQAGQVLQQGLADAVAAGSNFENALQSVSAVTGVTGTGLDDLGERAKNLALQFGGSATTQLEAFQTVLSKFGPDLAKTPEALGTVAESVNLLGKAAGLDAKASVDALSNSMLQFGVDASDPAKLAQESGRFINVLAASAKVGAAEIPQVADAILQAGVAAKGANLSFEETNAAIQQLAVGGKVGSEAGVGLRNVIGLLIKQGGPGEEALSKVGLSAQELGKTLTTQGLAAALEQLRGGVDKLGSDAEKAAFKATLFGSENAAAAGILLDGVDNIKAFTEGVTGTEEALTQAAINSDTLAARFDKFKAAIEVGLINAFQALAPLVKAVFDNFDVIGPILAVAAAGVAAYALAANAAAISQGIASAATAAWNAVLAANPVGLVAVAVVAATAAIIALADAMTISAGEALENAQAEKKLVEQQIASNKERKVSVTQTKSLTDEYQRLASKSQLTAQEQKRLTEIQGKLDRQYPNLIDQTKSFGENLEGVQKIGKLTTDELGKLDKQAQELAGRLEKATRNIAFAARNAAISELTDLTDRTLGVFGNKELERAGQAFANNIFQAKNAEDAQRAFAAFSETVNKLGIDAKDLNEIYGAANGVLTKTIATFTKQGEAATATADDVKKAEQAKATATEEGSKKAAKAAKEVPTAFDLAQKELKKIAERQKRDVELLKTELGEIGATPAEIKTKIALLERGQIEEFRRLATSLLGIEFKDGVPVNSTLKLGKDESVKDIVDEFEGIDLELRKRGLALRVPIEPERKQSLIKLNKVLAGLGFGADFLGLTVPITPEVKTDIAKDTLKTAAKAVQSLDWFAIFNTPAKASEEAVAKITNSISEGITSYQEGIDQLNASLAEQPSKFDKVMMKLNEKFSAAKDLSLQALNEQAQAYDAQLGFTNDFYNALYQTTTNAFLDLLTAQGDYGKNTLLIALDTLNALVPILVAQIVGKELADKTFVGLATGAALSAILYGLLGAAKAAVSGFAEGGYTGDGGKYTPAGIVHRGEFVINKENTRRYRGILEQMNDGNFPLALAGVPMQSNDGLMTEMSSVRTELSMIRKRLDSMPNGIEGRTAVALDVGFDQYLYSRNMHRTAVRNLRG
jgi:TP901 family phage tail tape measure protein